MVKVETEAPAPWRELPETANPSTLGKRTSPRSGSMRRIVIKCKIRPASLAGLEEGLPQTAGYTDRCGADEGHLVIFGRDENPWEEKVYRRIEEFAGKRIEVCGL